MQTLDLLHVALIALLYHLKLLLMLTFQHLESLRLILIRLQLMFQFLHFELAVTDQLSLFSEKTFLGIIIEFATPDLKMLPVSILYLDDLLERLLYLYSCN